jgi:hypothetical protein
MQDETTQSSESVPNHSEACRGVPQAAEGFGTLRHSSERETRAKIVISE